MARMSEMGLLEEMQKDNLWWKDGKIPKVNDKKFQRSDYFKYVEMLDLSGINIMVGARRVGKTVLFHQLIKYLMVGKGVEPRRILYLDLSRSYFSDVGIGDCLRVYQNRVIKQDFMDLDEGSLVYVFVDEVQRDKNWAVELETHRGRGLPLLFMVTGSSAPEIMIGTSKNLVGRANRRNILTLKFGDIVRMNLGYDDGDLEGIMELRDGFEEAVKKGDVGSFYGCLEDYCFGLSNDFKIKVKEILSDYFLRGGYPEFNGSGCDWDEVSAVMRDTYFDWIISKDVVEVFGVGKVDVVKNLYNWIALGTSNLMNFSNCARSIEIDKDTLRKYLVGLRETFLVVFSDVYSKSKKPKNTRKKAYVTDVGMRNAVLGRNRSQVESEIGKMAETVVVDHCRRLRYRLHPRSEFEVSYWRNKSTEVDVVLDLGNLVIPIEVKYRESIGRGKDRKGLRCFLEENEGTDFGIIVSKDELSLEENILAIPLWLFLLIC